RCPASAGRQREHCCHTEANTRRGQRGLANQDIRTDQRRAAKPQNHFGGRPERPRTGRTRLSALAKKLGTIAVASRRSPRIDGAKLAELGPMDSSRPGGFLFLEPRLE